MKDLKLTDNNRISFKYGDFETIERENRLKQQISTGLNILKRDWILDYRKGIDYIGGLRAYPDILKAQIKTAINEVFGVDRVLKYEFDNTGETYKVKCSVLSGNKEIMFEGTAGDI